MSPSLGTIWKNTRRLPWLFAKSGTKLNKFNDSLLHQKGFYVANTMSCIFEMDLHMMGAQQNSQTKLQSNPESDITYP